MNSTKKTGDEGEIVAIKYLKNKGYQIKDTNFKFGRFGEIDIVAQKDGKTVFVEVKYRTSLKYGIPEEGITKFKLRKFKRTIDYYVVKNGLDFERIRFDVIAILRGESSYKVTHYRNLEI